MYRNKLSGNIYYYQDGPEEPELYSVVCPVTGSGWGIPTKNITPKDLRAMADRLELVRAGSAVDKPAATQPGFEEWWHSVGSGITPIKDHDYEEHARRVACCAYAAGLGG